MADTPFAVRPPFPVLAQFLSQDEDFVNDLKLLGDLTEADFDAILSALRNHKTRLDRGSAISIVSTALPQNPDGERVGNVVFVLNSFVRNEADDTKAALSALTSAIIEHSESLGDAAAREVVATRVSHLVSEPEGFELYWKTKQLALATGKTLKKAKIICDMRPVFDESRSHIIGIIPIATVTISFSQSSRIEINVKEDQLRSLIAELSRGLDKLQALKNDQKFKDLIISDNI